MSRDLEALVFQKNKYAYKEALNAYSEVYDEIIRVRNQLDVVWSEQIDLFFIIKNYKNLDKPIII